MGLDTFLAEYFSAINVIYKGTLSCLKRLLSSGNTHSLYETPPGLSLRGRGRESPHYNYQHGKSSQNENCEELSTGSGSKGGRVTSKRVANKSPGRLYCLFKKKKKSHMHIKFHFNTQYLLKC